MATATVYGNAKEHAPNELLERNILTGSERVSSILTEGNNSEVTDIADALSLKLYNLTQIVKLAAFAAEARRTLTGIGHAMRYRPEMKAVIGDSVPYSNNWDELDDSTCDVLSYVTLEMEGVNSDFTDALYSLVPAKKNVSAA